MAHHEKERLLRIGLFSGLTAISVRMLRHYQDQGVLKPAFVDPLTGHRFYAPEQLTQAHWIVRLRDAGLSPSPISARSWPIAMILNACARSCPTIAGASRMNAPGWRT